jgi:hypothetical protein
MVPTQRSEKSGNQHGIVNRRPGRFGKPPLEPPRSKPAGSWAVLQCRERGQFERVGEVEPADLKRGDFGNDEVASFDRLLEDRGRGAVVAPSPGPGSAGSLPASSRRDGPGAERPSSSRFAH